VPATSVANAEAPELKLINAAWQLAAGDAAGCNQPGEDVGAVRRQPIPRRLLRAPLRGRMVRGAWSKSEGEESAGGSADRPSAALLGPWPVSGGGCQQGRAEYTRHLKLKEIIS